MQQVTGMDTYLLMQVCPRDLGLRLNSGRHFCKPTDTNKVSNTKLRRHRPNDAGYKSFQ